MSTTLRTTKFSGKSVRTGLVVSLALVSLVAGSVPSRAGNNGGAIAAGVLGAIALGTIAGAAAAHAAPPPQQQPQIRYVPVYVNQPVRRAPRHCWYEKREVYDGEDYIAKKVKVCP